jgi:hypothetical protein
MAMEHDLAEVESFIKEGQILAEKYGPSGLRDPGAPVSDTSLLILFTSWRGRAMRFVHLQTGAHSESSRAFSRNCGAGGSYNDIMAGIEELEKVKQGILDGVFERRGVELFISHPGKENP